MDSCCSNSHNTDWLFDFLSLQLSCVVFVSSITSIRLTAVKLNRRGYIPRGNGETKPPLRLVLPPLQKHITAVMIKRTRTVIVTTKAVVVASSSAFDSDGACISSCSFLYGFLSIAELNFRNTQKKKYRNHKQNKRNHKSTFHGKPGIWALLFN